MNFWQDRSVFVTGATGLVGGWTVERLVAAGASVVCLVRDEVPGTLFARKGLGPKVSVVRGDIEDQACLERVLGEYEAEVVLHLAAQTIVPVANRNPVSTFQANIAGTWCLLEACRRSPRVRGIVVASSDKAYGAHGPQPYGEEMPLQGRHPYDVSKSCADLIAQSYAVTYGLPVTITRCGNFYGGGDLNWSRIVPGTVRSVLRGERPVVRSDGSPVRDWFYVEDGAAAYLCLAERLCADSSIAGRAYNFSNEESASVGELVRRIIRQMGSDLTPDIRGDATHEIDYQRLDATRARTELGWRPNWSLATGLDAAIAWYREALADGV